MNTLHAPPSIPASAAAPRSAVPTSRASFVERTAMRLGLRLLLWGRRRSRLRVSRDAHARQQLAEQVRRDRDRTLAHAASTRSIL